MECIMKESITVTLIPAEKEMDICIARFFNGATQKWRNFSKKPKALGVQTVMLWFLFLIIAESLPRNLAEGKRLRATQPHSDERPFFLDFAVRVPASAAGSRDREPVLENRTRRDDRPRGPREPNGHRGEAKNNSLNGFLSRLRTLLVSKNLPCNNLEFFFSLQSSFFLLFFCIFPSAADVCAKDDHELNREGRPPYTCYGLDILLKGFFLRWRFHSNAKGGWFLTYLVRVYLLCNSTVLSVSLLWWMTFVERGISKLTIVIISTLPNRTEIPSL